MEQRRWVVNRLAGAVASLNLGHATRVAIDGRTASGKTTLAAELAEALRRRGRPVILTSIDGFHRPKAERYRQGRHSPKGYYEDARDLKAVRRLLLDPLGPGGDSRYRTASFDLESDVPVDVPSREAEPNAILIVDGTFLQRPALAPAWDFVVFVEVPAELALARGAARDADLLGGMEAATDMHAKRYQAAFVLYATQCDPLARADAVIDNSDLVWRFRNSPRLDGGLGANFGIKSHTRRN
jgi:uridine kinase